MINFIAPLVFAIAASGQSPIGCECPESIGAQAGEDPLVVVYDIGHQPALIACGYLKSRGPGHRAIASEFQVFRCGTTNALLTYYATQTCILEAKPTQLKLTEVDRWPFGEGWSWVDSPIWEVVLHTGPNLLTKRRMILHPPELTEQQIVATLRQYESQRDHKPQSEETQDLEDLIGRILAVALAGNLEGQHDLRMMRQEFALDGGDAEVYMRAVAVTGYYPALSCVRYAPAKDEYTVSMEDFVLRHASPPGPVRDEARSQP